MNYDSYIWLSPPTTISSKCIAFQRISIGTEIFIIKTVHPAPKYVFPGYLN